MKQKPVQCVVLGLTFILPSIAFAFQGQQLKVGVSVTGGCTFEDGTVQHAHFGSHLAGRPHSPVAANGYVEFWCSPGTTIQIGVDDGQNPNAGMRRMKGPGPTDYISYTLQHNPQQAIGGGPGAATRVNVDFTLPADAMLNAAQGEYEDTVTVTANE
ncbi:SCPU domain-containing protein [Dyella monticola]|uniref:SCPU domain-containing protein n=1 Tax=Dyella monticola TaxID=1927958 RepID=A0A370X4G1_9GAMM|nr:spore coat U domain-containing protein [Dyella monticola]RDS83105.1 SCPU domain-containing protein [Dyella monticola]